MNDKIVNEELDLLRRVIDAVDQAPTTSPPSEDGIVDELERIRQALVEGTDSKDEGALMQQWDRQSALLKQLRESRKAPLVDRNSPYFGHLQLREGKVNLDLCLGKATLIRGGVSIVDWRNAPISSIFYRYKQGDEYEEAQMCHPFFEQLHGLLQVEIVPLQHADNLIQTIQALLQRRMDFTH